MNLKIAVGNYLQNHGASCCSHALYRLNYLYFFLDAGKASIPS